MCMRPDDASDDHPDQPFLPPELEQVIVETAALEGVRFPLGSANCCLNLQLTAKRFRDWTVPFFYRVLHTDKFFLNREEAECMDILRKHGGRTSHIYLGTNKTKATKILEHCPNVEDIVNWHDEITIKDIQRTLQHISTLKRLSGFMEMLTVEMVLSPVYLNITHLDVMDSMNWDLLVRFPRLSHLCFTYAPFGMAGLLARLTHKDSGCKSLRVIVCLYQTWHQCADERFVMLVLPNTHEDHEVDWISGANGGMDFWEFAERIVTARKGALARKYCRKPPHLLMYTYQFQNTHFYVAKYLRDNSTHAVYRPPPFFNTNTDLTEQGRLWWSKKRC